MTTNSKDYPGAAWRLDEKVFYGVLIAITALAAGLRLFRLDTWGFWIDEIHSVRQAAELIHMDFGARVLGAASAALSLKMGGVDLSQLANENYWLYKAAGVNEWLARLPVALTGIVSVFLLGLASSRFLGRAVALVAVLLVALSTWHIWMSQVSRFYAQQFLFFNLSVVCYYIATESDRFRQRYWIATTVFFVLAFTSQITSLLLIAIFGLDWLFSRARGQPVVWGRLGWSCAFAAVAVCIALFLWSFASEPQNYTHFKSGNQSIADLILGLPYLVGAVVAAMAVLSACMLYRQQPRRILYLVSGALLPLIVFSLFKLMGKDVHIRYLFMALFPWLALAALGLVELFGILRERRGLIAGFAPVAVVCAGMAVSDFEYFAGGYGFRHRYKEAYEYIAAHRRPGEGFVADWNADILGTYYLEEKPLLTLTGAEDLDRLRKPTWIVVNAESGLYGSRFNFLDEFADFKAYFNTRVAQPYSSVHVYYFDPSRYRLGP